MTVIPRSLAFAAAPAASRDKPGDVLAQQIKF
jgi:hypothetical protein